MPALSRTVVAVFDDYATAERAVNDLVSNGFSRDNIEVTSNNNLASDSALGNTGLSGREPRDRSGGGIGGFFRRLFGDDEYAGHYDEAIRRGGTVVSVTTDDEDRAADILDRNGAVDVEERAATWRQEGYGARSNLSSGDLIRDRRDTAEHSIPVVREELHVGKRDVRRGGVRVFNRITEQPVEEHVQLREERVRVDRRSADRPATEADFRAQDDVIEVTEMAEEPVVGKTARVVEEVVVGKDTTQRTETVRDTVRRTDVSVENLGTDRSFADYDDDFRQDFNARYGSTRGAKYETYAPAYQYGYRMASDERYRGRSWNEVEANLRTDYERDYPGGKWEQMKDSVRYGWEKITGRR
jgi:uncharacterized protein (TIGR02271 family)